MNGEQIFALCAVVAVLALAFGLWAGERVGRDAAAREAEWERFKNSPQAQRFWRNVWFR